MKWFTDIPATNGYPKTVILHAADPMTLIDMGPAGSVRKLDGKDPLHRGIAEVMSTPSFLTCNYTDNYQADCAVAALQAARLSHHRPGRARLACRMPS